MRKSVLWLAFVVTVAAGAVAARAQMTPWLQWTLLPKAAMSEIVGETSGENAWKMVMETGGYDRDRTPGEYAGTFHEAQFYLDRARQYGLKDAEIVRFPGGTTWDAVKGELWEVAPNRQKLASYLDSAAMLATGSTNADVEAELMWVGAGRPDDLAGKDLAGKIVVTDGSIAAVHGLACVGKGAVGVIGVLNSPRPLFDPLQMAWASLGGRGEAAGTPAKFAFQLPPREGDLLKRRLLAGQKITVHAQVVAENRPYEIQDVVWSIPGTDPSAGEVIFSAHLFEGYVKMGGNDDISGCAALLEIARTLNTLIAEGRLAPPKRTIRFLIGPEFSGTGPWAKANKALMEKTLCNINLDMVGLWLSRSQSFMCLMRTTYGNPHYINDVMENYYRFVGEGSRERIPGNTPSQRIVSPTGSDEPFYYNIEVHYGASDHEVFNDWGVQVPGVMMIDWPDRWYHTSEDHVDKTDPTTLKRVATIGAAAAYTIASADDEMAIRIAGETAANASVRLRYQLARAMEALNGATGEGLFDVYRAARGYVEAALINERDTLETVNELAVDRKRVAGHVALLQKSVEQVAAAHLATLEAQMRAAATRLGTAPVALKPTDLEAKASAVVPRPTAKVTANGYQGWREVLNQVPQDQRAKFPAGRLDVAELQRLVNGRHSALDIKKMLDAQAQAPADLQQVLNYLEVLALAGLVEK
ncbi:MAG TPA: M28 family peptidase [Vicinamibacterales bacterium]|nr:M28 family peptidase [Vicinamibacterales bacterium]